MDSLQKTAALVAFFGCFQALAQPAELDSTFTIGNGIAGSLPVGIALTVIGIGEQSDGKLVVGGNFESIRDIPRKGIARLTPAGEVDLSFNLTFNTTPRSLVVGTNDLIGISVSSSGDNIFKLGRDGDVFASYRATASVVGFSPDGQLYAAGTGLFSERGQVSGWSSVYSFAFGQFVVKDKPRSIVVGGNFAGGYAFVGSPSSENGPNTVYDVAVTPNNQIVISAGFYLFKVNPDGSQDLTFGNISERAAFDGMIWAIVVQPDGKIIIGGDFTHFLDPSGNHTVRNRIARLNPNGSLDLTFDPGRGLDGAVKAICLQRNGRIVIGGEFRSYNGVSRKGVARLMGDVPPQIIEQPKGQAVLFGDPLKLSVKATTTGASIAYQWRFNGSDIPQATNTTCAIPNLQPANEGRYSVNIVAGGSATLSAEAFVRVVSLIPQVTRPTFSVQKGFAALLENAESGVSVEYSTDLKTWSLLKSFPSPSEPQPVTDTTQTPFRFYRAVVR